MRPIRLCAYAVLVLLLAGGLGAQLSSATPSHPKRQQADASERSNLADDPQHRATLVQMRELEAAGWESVRPKG